ncbi:helix-turn-helix transcriptional regulator [Leclercia adecarboxylata]|uniref:helix-turn-helix transcriptional regulator n=1 Tax=Leclercia adecarboxylata TaxID=83655 RepID=UPI0013C6FA39|nr:helix-turn-helix transcriptional regulator [Leclercia adecarboxylata]NEG94071.1 helix-turn-helix domain-containing protein [Leclercia adecarboxylata]
MTFPGKRFSNALKASGKTQDDAAYEMGISPSKLSRYLTQKLPLSVDLAKRFSVYFGVDFLTIISEQAEYELQSLPAESFTLIKPLSDKNE